jgi:hypothetical protein
VPRHFLQRPASYDLSLYKTLCPRGVLFSTDSDQIADITALRICASLGLMHRSKQLKLFDHVVGAGEQKNAGL